MVHEANIECFAMEVMPTSDGARVSSRAEYMSARCRLVVLAKR